LQGLGVKESGGLGESPEGGAGCAKFALDLVEATGLLDSAEAGKEGVEEGQQDEGGIVIEEESSIAGVVASSGDVVEWLEEGLESFEVFESLNVVVGKWGFAWTGHEGILWHRLSKWRVFPPEEDAAAFMPTDAKTRE